MDREEIRHHLKGPVTSIHTPFNRDGSIDYNGLRTLIDTCIGNGSKTMILTAGDSHFLCLSDAEIAELTKVTVEHSAGRAMVISADRYHSTQRAVEFAKFCREVGADVHISMPPDWAESCTVDTLAEHYAEVAKVLPLMIITNIFGIVGQRGGQFGLDAIRLSMEKSANIVAIKDDTGDTFAQRMCLMVHERCVVMAGGQKQTHLNILPFGCESYMSTYLQFYPEITRRYWAAIGAGDLETAWRIAREYDQAFFQFLSCLRGGWNAGLHGTFELFGICQRWRRKPYYSLNDEEMETIGDFFRRLSIL